MAAATCGAVVLGPKSTAASAAVSPTQCALASAGSRTRLAIRAFADHRSSASSWSAARAPREAAVARAPRAADLAGSIERLYPETTVSRALRTEGGGISSRRSSRSQPRSRRRRPAGPRASRKTVVLCPEATGEKCRSTPTRASAARTIRPAASSPVLATRAVVSPRTAAWAVSRAAVPPNARVADRSCGRSRATSPTPSQSNAAGMAAMISTEAVCPCQLWPAAATGTGRIGGAASAPTAAAACPPAAAWRVLPGSCGLGATVGAGVRTGLACTAGAASRDRAGTRSAAPAGGVRAASEARPRSTRPATAWPTSRTWAAGGASSERPKQLAAVRTIAASVRRSPVRRGVRWAYGQPAGSTDEPLPPRTRRQPGRLVPLGPGRAGKGAGRGPSHPLEHRLQRLPLVPRHGPRIVRGPGDGRADEPVLRLHQGRPRGATRPRPGLHARSPGNDRLRRVADDRLPAPRWNALLRRDLFPAGG